MSDDAMPSLLIEKNIKQMVECHLPLNEGDVPSSSSSNPNHLSLYNFSKNQDIIFENEDNYQETFDPAIAKRNVKYTPLELQVLDFKKNCPNTILMIECGYKYRLFGEDAQITSKELGIGCFLSHNFLTSSFPIHRLHVHVRRLIANGHKVGVVKQTESTAIKASGENRNTLFARKLHAIYTPSTYIEEGICSADDSFEVPSYEGCLICINEVSLSPGAHTHVGIIAVDVSSGDVLYASHGISQVQLENCLSIVNPVEFLLPRTLLSASTENLIRSYCEVKNISGVKVRVERREDDVFDFSSALQGVSHFYGISANDGHSLSDVVQTVYNLHPSVICCLFPTILYLSEFCLESVLKDYEHFKPLQSSLNHMTLNGSAIRCLELTENLADHKEHGSLLQTVNFTRSKFGKKLFKSWLLKPLKNLREITDRQCAVEAVLHSETPLWIIVEKMLSALPDLERLLSAAFYHRCTIDEFETLINAFIQVKTSITTILERIDLDIENAYLKNMLAQNVTLLEGIENFISNITDISIREMNKTNIFKDFSQYSNICECKTQMKTIEEKLKTLEIKLSTFLGLPSFKYSCVMGQNYLIEVSNSFTSHVPSTWLKISSTKHVSRFQSPEIITLVRELEKYSEMLQFACNQAWDDFLNDFGKNFYKYKTVVQNLATLDCILSFAKLAKKKDYTKPIFEESYSGKTCLIQGRNPIMCNVLGEEGQYISNDFKLEDEERCVIITGPNMGGKSSYVRQIALISILAQAGSYVPADYASLPLYDGIYVKMGSEDDLCAKRSTFLVELEEMSAILKAATSNSLVILDELGQGTSSNDGAAIAYATLLHMIKEIQCTILFVTHYPDIAKTLQFMHPERVKNCHLSFISLGEYDSDDVTFLYSVLDGIATESYGINVARLAGIPEEILVRAKQKSQEIRKNEKKIK